MGPDRESPVDRARKATASELYPLIRRADDRVLDAILENPACEPSHVILILRRPHLDRRIVQKVLDRSDWVEYYQVKAGLVLCPATPYPVSTRLIHDLFWRDLAKVAQDFHLDPRLRRTAERRILQQLEQLSLGERMTLMRIATRNLLAHLRNLEHHPKVLIAMLRNPRIVEEDLLAVLNRPEIPVEFIRTLAGKPHWVMREQVRTAVLRHPHTPTHVAMQIARKLHRSQLRKLLADPKIRATIKQNLRFYFKL